MHSLVLGVRVKGSAERLHKYIKNIEIYVKLVNRVEHKPLNFVGTCHVTYPETIGDFSGDGNVTNWCCLGTQKIRRLLLGTDGYGRRTWQWFWGRVATSGGQPPIVMTGWSSRWRCV